MRFSLPLALALLPLPLMAQVPHVVTDIPPVQALVAQVMGDLGAPQLLLEQGANAHGFSLRPSQAAGLQRAGLVVWIGPEMTPWLARVLEGPGAGAARLGLLAAEGTFRREFDDHDGHDHDGDHAGHNHDDHGHSHDGVDPHAWLDPANGQHWLGLIAAELGRLDPGNAAAYAENAAAAQARLGALDRQIATELAGLADRPFVTGHDAYGYFTAHYGLASAGSLAHGDAAAPGAARLGALRAQLAEGGVVCAFPEVGQDPKLLETVLQGSGVRLGAALDPEGRGVPPGPLGYEAILTGLAAGLAGCLSQ